MTSIKTTGSILARWAALVVTAATVCTAATTYTVINTFNNANGAKPMAGLILDLAGNLYGTTSTGGMGKGVVFELSPNKDGSWSEVVLYQFGSQKNDGSDPFDKLVFDANGNLYGTTQHGGTHNAGTVFELSPASGGAWTETILHNFGSIANDGSAPIAGLTIDSAGNLYGTTFAGGAVKTCKLSGKPYSCGTAFELSPVAGGGWNYSVIHSFSNVQDGYFPIAGLTFGPTGYLYGEAAYGATYGQGLLFQLVPGSGGTWTEQGLHVWGFVHEGRPDGGYPYSAVVFDSNGLMYGTSNIGGTHGDLGTVFSFTSEGGNAWRETNLHGFGNAPQGSYPESSLLVDNAGNLYGTTNKGGTAGDGTVYKLEPSAQGYVYFQLYNFTGGIDGGLPTGSLVMDGAGNLYGTTPSGGDASQCTTGTVKGCGVVFKISAN
jgi:uncharacterized repeat protein (TIGR03803 family)